MTPQALENLLRPYEQPVEGELLRWLYLHLPPRPIASRKEHAAYSKAVSILMRQLELGELAQEDRRAVELYLKVVAPFIEEYERKELGLGSSSPEDMLRFLMEQNGLTQYDLAEDLGGQPVVSNILNGKRQLTRKHIERLSRRFSLSPAAFYR